MRWRGALRKEVVDLETAETIGKVRDLILDLPSSTVSALVVDDLVLDWSQADGIGRSVVTVERASCSAFSTVAESKRSRTLGGR